MVQKEFAERMAAKAGCDDYSRLSVNTYYRAKCEILESVLPLEVLAAARGRLIDGPFGAEAAAVQGPERAVLPELGRMLFQHRRKKIGTVLRMTGSATKDSVASLPFIDERVEQLTPEEIGVLSDAVLAVKAKK